MEIPVSLILIIVASIYNAVMDTVIHHHSTSIFKHHKKGFWSDGYVESWRNKYVGGYIENGRRKLFWNINYPVQFTDAWHFSKMCMIILIVLAIVFYKPMFNWWADIVIFGVAWNLTFSLFYDKFLRRGH